MPSSPFFAVVRALQGALAPSLLVAAPLAFLLWRSGAVSPLAAGSTMVVFALLVFATGSALLGVANAADMSAPSAWVLGVAATAVSVLALVMAFDVLAFTAFAIWGALVFSGMALLRTRRPGPASADRKSLIGLALCGAATVFWTADIAAVPSILWHDGVMATWLDQFIHGATISQFGDVRAAGRQAIELVDFPRPRYHYASYMLPAAFAWPLDLPGLPLATSLWLPLGFFTMCAGAYALGETLSGSWGGVAALAVLTTIPDASSYGLHNLSFAFHWYQLAVPGGCYGVGVALLAIALLCRWAKARNRRALAAGACVIAVSLAVRVHVFLLAFPAWLAAALFAAPIGRRCKLGLGLAAGAALALFVFGYYSLLPEAEPALVPFLDATDSHLHQLLPYQAATLPARVLLVLPSALGVFLILYPLSLLLMRRSRALECMDFVPLIFIVCYLVLMVSAPIPRNGDPTELTQRPFVLVYAIVAVWSSAGIADWAVKHSRRRPLSVRLGLVIAIALCSIATLLFTVGDFRWHRVHPIDDGVPQAARYLRQEWRPGDVFAVADLKQGRVYTDIAIQISSMAGIPAYLARPFIHIRHGGAARQTALERYQTLVEVASEEDLPVALARLREAGVRWYIVPGHAGPRWDPDRRGAAFVAGAVTVYSSDAASL